MTRYQFVILVVRHGKDSNVQSPFGMAIYKGLGTTCGLKKNNFFSFKVALMHEKGFVKSLKQHRRLSINFSENVNESIDVNVVLKLET